MSNDSSLVTASVVLQQGTNNYSGMTNSWINGATGQTTTNYSENPTLYVDGAAGSEMDTLLRWDLTALSPSETIESASITLNVEGLAGTPGPVNLYALDQPWNPDTVTFEQASSGLPWEVPGAHGATDAGTTILGTFDPTSTGEASITLNAAGITALQTWVDNPSLNYGFILRSTSGEMFVSSNLDAATPVRPSLSVTYAYPPITVNAGPNTAVTQTSVLTLDGSVQDNESQTATSTWSLVSGPGTVTFENASSPTSDAIFSTVGTYVLQLSATDGLNSASSQVTVNVEAPPSDLPPVVNAGSSQTITLGQVATLSGTVTQTTTNPLTDQWTQESGPGTAIFANAQSPSTTVQFTAAGTYVLDLSATDGTMAGSSSVTITVNPASTPSTTTPPVVSAGSNQTISQTATATLSGTVTYTAQSGATLSTVWQVANGPGTVTFANSASPQTTATFSAAGTYYLRLLATYAGVSDQSYTIITVNAASQSTTLNLQDGTNGYTGETDTISERFQRGRRRQLFDIDDAFCHRPCTQQGGRRALAVESDGSRTHRSDDSIRIDPGRRHGRLDRHVQPLCP